MDLNFKGVDEQERTYIFPDKEIAIANVVRVAVRPSGTHRLETAEGDKYIIQPGWRAIRLKMENWSF